jgi:hypothetical protein
MNRAAAEGGDAVKRKNNSRINFNASKAYGAVRSWRPFLTSKMLKREIDRHASILTIQRYCLIVTPSLPRHGDGLAHEKEQP